MVMLPHHHDGLAVVTPVVHQRSDGLLGAQIELRREIDAGNGTDENVVTGISHVAAAG